MKTNQIQNHSLSPEAIGKLKNVLDRLRKKCSPVYASARPWDWKVCRGCRQLVGRDEPQCAACGSRRFNVSPLKVFRTGLRLYGIPPGLFE